MSPSGWVQVLRGPRPRAEKWPSAAQKRSSTEIPNSKPVGRWRQPGVQPPEAARERGPDPDTALQEARRRVASLEAALQAMGDFQGPEVDVLKNALSRAQASSPNTSSEGTACTERHFHPAFAEANCISGAGTRRRRGVVGQGSGSARTVETGGGSSRTSARRGPHAGVEHGGVVPQGEGGPVGSGTNPASSPRVRRRRREFAVVIDEAQNRELSRVQFADESTRSLFLVGVKAVGVARCPRRSRHGISQFVDGADFQRRLCYEQFSATVFVGAHGALIGAWREAGYGLRGARIGEASNPGPRRVRTLQPVGEDVATSDSEDRPIVGTVVAAPSTFRHTTIAGWLSECWMTLARECG